MPLANEASFHVNRHCAEPENNPLFSNHNHVLRPVQDGDAGDAQQVDPRRAGEPLHHSAAADRARAAAPQDLPHARQLPHLLTI